MSIDSQHITIHDISPGMLLLDRYEVVRRLGSGATGTVYECYDRVLGNLKIALKVIINTGPQGNRALARLDREIRACFRIQSPYVVKFYDLVEIGDTLGYTMEYVEGGSVEQWRKGSLQLPLAWRVGLFHYICQGLQAIHEAGVIHRDIKPANVLLNHQGFPKITDFGLARLVETNLAGDGALPAEGGAPILTRVSNERGLLGTPEFMAPESVESNVFNEQTDLYSLGVTGFELLTGRQLYTFSNIAELLTLKLNQDPAKAHDANPEIPDNISQLVGYLLKRNPAERYQTAREVVEHLQTAMHYARLSPLMSFPTRTPEKRLEELERDTGSAFDFSFGWRPVFQDAASELKEFVNSGPIVIGGNEKPRNPKKSRRGFDFNIWLTLAAWLSFISLLAFNIFFWTEPKEEENPHIKKRSLMSRIFDPFQPRKDQHK